jgi:hypothetical protein
MDVYPKTIYTLFGGVIIAMTPKEYEEGLRIKWIERVGFVVVLGVLVYMGW